VTHIDHLTGIACFVLCNSEELEREAVAASHEGLPFFTAWLTEHVGLIAAASVDMPKLWKLMQ